MGFKFRSAQGSSYRDYRNGSVFLVDAAYSVIGSATVWDYLQ
jgi:hypothetical protein